MPEWGGAGAIVTWTVLPECSPTPERLTGFRIVFWYMAGEEGSNRGAMARPRCKFCKDRNYLAIRLTGRLQAVA